MRRFLHPAAVLFLCAACGPGTPEDSGFTVRDSAGVRIAESAGPAWASGEGWTVAESPLVEIGTVDGDEATRFTSPWAGRMLPDGGFQVLDADTHSIRSFSSQGELLWSTGRFGGGPGEFGLPWAMDVLPPDSLMVFDRSRATISIFSAEGVFVRSFILGAPDRLRGTTKSIFAFPGRSLVVGFGGSTVLLAERPTAGSARERDPVLRLDVEDGSVVDTLGVFPGMEWFAGEGMIGPPIFGTNVTFARQDSLLVVGTTEDLSVSLYSVDGALQAIIRAPNEDLTLTQEDVAERQDLLLERVQSPQGVAAIRRLMDAMPVPERKPAYSSVMTDADGNLWLTEFPVRSLYSGSAFVFSHDGRYLGVVALPPRFRLLAVGSDRLLGSRLDDLDVPHVGVWAIRK